VLEVVEGRRAAALAARPATPEMTALPHTYAGEDRSDAPEAASQDPDAQADGGSDGAAPAGGEGVANAPADGVAEPSETAAPAPRPRAVPVRERGPRPLVVRSLPLAAYSDDQLDDLVAWIESDGAEREDTELVEELRAELALTRRGAQVDAVLGHVVRRRAR
jgi:hypothetical protein